MGARLMAVVAEGARQRVYLPPTEEMEDVARRATPMWRPEGELPNDHRNFWTVEYGLTELGDLFTPRQLVALTTFSDLVGEAMERARTDAAAAGLPDDDVLFYCGGIGARAYAEAVGVNLALAANRCADFSNTCTRWVSGNQKVMNLFGKQAIPMTWDFPEAAPLASSVGGLAPAAEFVSKCLGLLPANGSGFAVQRDAATTTFGDNRFVSTDPPYYDNVGYADLSDFFYVWLRRSLRRVFPDLFATVAVPKAQELVATPHRHGGRVEAERFFLSGMTRAIARLAAEAHPAFPTSIYYAFKQSEAKDNSGVSSTGWETFLDAVMRSGFTVTGTWPMRTEQSTRIMGLGTNALASSIVLACRKRPPNSPSTTRRGFLAALHAELPEAIARLQAENIAPVDLAQAAIGPGMAIFTRYSRVLEADDSPMTVRMALALINAELDQILSAQDADYDPWTRFAVTWFETKGMDSGPYGDAETLATARASRSRAWSTPESLKRRPARRDSCAATNSTPIGPRRPTAASLSGSAPSMSPAASTTAANSTPPPSSRASATARAAAHALAYRLYGICDRKKLAEEGLIWNELVQIWPRLTELAPSALGSTLRHEDVFLGPTAEKVQ